MMRRHSGVERPTGIARCGRFVARDGNQGLPVAPAAVFLLLVGVVVVLLSRSAMLIQFLKSRSAALGGRLALVAVSLIALPGCLSGLSSIAGRTP